MAWLSRFKAWATQGDDKIGVVPDKVLGPLELVDDLWEARLAVSDRVVYIHIGGQHEPDPMLLAHARQIAQGFPEFEAEVRTHLDAEAARDRWARFAEEIRALVIREVGLFWPKRPGDGMVFFDGPDERRFWRCDIIGRSPVGLGYDS